MILLCRKPDRLTKKLLELIHEFSKNAGYKIKLQKFLESIIKQQKGKPKAQSHLQLHQKTRYLALNPTKEVKDLSSEKYITLMIEIEDDTKKRKDILCPWI